MGFIAPSFPSLPPGLQRGTAPSHPTYRDNDTSFRLLPCPVSLFDMKYNEKIVLAFWDGEGVQLKPEFRFDSTRKWRADFMVIHPSRILIEVEGGVWTKGRHTRGDGFVKDIEKYNAAAIKGYRVMRCIPDNLCTVEFVNRVKRAMEWNPVPVDTEEEGPEDA